MCARFEEPEVQELLQSNIPIVTVDYVYHNCTVVSSNNVKGMNELVRYIYSKGHRKIAYIYGEKYSAVTRDRLTSFFQTMESFNLNVPDDYLKEGEYLDTRLVAKATRELLNLPDPPTCILYPDDTALIGGINVIDEMGLKVPDDISIAGFDGTKVSQMMSPKITTIRQNTRKIGEEVRKTSGTENRAAEDNAGGACDYQWRTFGRRISRRNLIWHCNLCWAVLEAESQAMYSAKQSKKLRRI